MNQQQQARALDTGPLHRYGRPAAAPGGTPLATASSPIASASPAPLALVPVGSETRGMDLPLPQKRGGERAGDHYDRRRRGSPACHQSGSSPSSRSHSSVRAARSQSLPVWPQNFQSSRAERL